MNGPLLYGYAAAAERSGIPEHWLRRNIRRLNLPHSRFGKHVRFGDDDIAAIRELHRVNPTGTPSTPANGALIPGRAPRRRNAQREAA